MELLAIKHMANKFLDFLERQYQYLVRTSNYRTDLDFDHFWGRYYWWIVAVVALAIVLLFLIVILININIKRHE